MARQKLIDSLWVGALVSYVIMGVVLVPFHGDESTIIYASHDWYTLVQAHDLPAVLFRDPPPNPRAATDQQLRISNGVLSEYTIGLLASLAGFGAADLNDQWLWGADLNYNRDTGHVPGGGLLFVARLSSTLLAALSVAVVFAIGRRLGGRGVAWHAAFVYAVMPSVLLNGRRAMFEGAFLLTIALVMLVGLEVARRIPHRVPREGWLLLGVVSGLALASKHTALITVFVVVATLLYLGRCHLRQTLVHAFSALVVAGGTFLALNPAWWSAPLQVPGEVLRWRQELITGQIAQFGGYTNVAERLVALVQQPLGDPHYYEDARGWPQWIGGQIAAYEASGLVGLKWLAIAAYPILALALLQLPRTPEIALFLVVTMFTAAALLILTPLPWQRYYLPLAVSWAILYGFGLTAAWRLVGSALRSRNA
jgi:4-amino-4-deoxy-L-arabinose transferase-like glycosyltransferase